MRGLLLRVAERIERVAGHLESDGAPAAALLEQLRAAADAVGAHGRVPRDGARVAARGAEVLRILRGRPNEELAHSTLRLKLGCSWHGLEWALVSLLAQGLVIERRLQGTRGNRRLFRAAPVASARPIAPPVRKKQVA
jgi:hypothetical protein